MIENNIVAKRKRKLNFALLAKVSPVGYNGLTYYVLQNTNYTNLNTAAQSIIINYSWDGNYANNQTWTVTGIVNGSTPVTPTGYPSGAVTTTGDWFAADPPGGAGWEYRTSYNGGSTYTAWTALAVSPTNAVATITINGGGTSDVAVTNTSCVIQVRSISSPGTVVSTSFTARLEYDYVPTLETFTTAGSGSWTRPNANITTISAAVIGGGGGGGGGFRNNGTRGENNGSAGGGGASAIAVTQNSIAITGAAISYTVGSAGIAGNALGNNGGAGGNSIITILGTPYTSTGGGGGSGSTSLHGGNGGTNTVYFGGNGGFGAIEDSVGGGGAGATGNGGDGDTVNTTGGLGGPGATINIVTLAGNSVSLTYGVGGQGGTSLPATGTGAAGTAPGGGGEGGGVLVFQPLSPAPLVSAGAAGGPGAVGRVYIYY